MPDANVVRIRLCGDCGEAASSMDTVCPRCQRRGTLSDRYQCLRCRNIMEESSCAICEERHAVRAGIDNRPLPRRLDELDPVADVSKKDIPAWLAGCVGGTIFGAAAGAITCFFLGESVILGGIIGLVPGAVAGAVLTREPH